jgi:hypothetical protein
MCSLKKTHIHTPPPTDRVDALAANVSFPKLACMCVHVCTCMCACVALNHLPFSSWSEIILNEYLGHFTLVKKGILWQDL